MAEEDEEGRRFAEEIGLRYAVSHQTPGYHRRPWGRGFTYYDDEGERIPRSSAVRGYIEGLALPPAWDRVWISAWSDAHLLATGRDDAGRRQYRYHERWSEARRQWRDGRLADFATCLPQLRRRVETLLASQEPTHDVVHAAAVRMLDHAAIRVGNRASAREHGTRGLTTLRNADAELRRRGVRLAFEGKGGVEREVAIDDPDLAQVIRRAEDLDPHLLAFRCDGEVGRVTGRSLNAFLREQTGEAIHAHMFRSWQATVEVLAALREVPPPGSDREAGIRLNEVTEPVADRLGHTVATCRGHYVHHRVEALWRDGRLAEIEPVPVAGLEPDERYTLGALRAEVEPAHTA